jgi:hypothetical protein
LFLVAGVIENATFASLLRFGKEEEEEEKREK